MSEDEESPEHGALGEPVERPEGPAVERGSGESEQGDDDCVAEDVAHGPQGVLHPAVAGDGRPDVADPEGRRLPGLDLPRRRLLGVECIHLLFLRRRHRLLERRDGLKPGPDVEERDSGTREVGEPHGRLAASLGGGGVWKDMSGVRCVLMADPPWPLSHSLSLSYSHSLSSHVDVKLIHMVISGMRHE